ncbi:peroxiredoxin q, chloroplastic [Olea europaea subsp. europaea]|uniref:Peroxiredoxin Q, chloroplastic n=1 Tax=Olea europaea subsp. europaea TaxID=158383 RepID=A0A8S0TTP8_OLEEU|nr:peroxiredoxin q, chloroplastic [Olea europaea subsp. europaea]
MASFSLSTNHSLPFPLYAQTPKLTLFQNLSPLSRYSQSQFYGLKLSHSSYLPIPVSSLVKSSIVAKVSEGSVPPPFTLKDQDGRNISLSNFKGMPVVVYFYPGDETPGCTKQACAFRDSYEKFKKAGAEVVGISGDDAASHKVTRLEKSGASRETYSVHCWDGKLMFLTRMEWFDLCTIISSSLKSILMRP